VTASHSSENRSIKQAGVRNARQEWQAGVCRAGNAVTACKEANNATGSGKCGNSSGDSARIAGWTRRGRTTRLRAPLKDNNAGGGRNKLWQAARMHARRRVQAARCRGNVTKTTVCCLLHEARQYVQQSVHLYTSGKAGVRALRCGVWPVHISAAGRMRVPNRQNEKIAEGEECERNQNWQPRETVAWWRLAGGRACRGGCVVACAVVGRAERQWSGVRTRRR